MSSSDVASDACLALVEGTLELLPAKLGHNVCKVCKDLGFQRDKASHKHSLAVLELKGATETELAARNQALPARLGRADAARHHVI